MNDFRKHFDFGIDLDNVIEAAKEFGAKIREMAPEMKAEWFDPCHQQGSCRAEGPRHESARPQWYSYPPFNSFVDGDESIVMEFAMAGMDESSVSISFLGDYLVLDARLAAQRDAGDEQRYSRHGFRPRDVRRQKYYVPAEDYAQDKAKAVLKHGVLTVTVPQKDIPEGSGVRIEIVKEGN